MTTQSYGQGNFNMSVRKGMVRIGLMVLLFCLSSPGFARGQGGWPPVIGGQFRPLTKMRGEIVCVGCSLSQARRVRPDAIHLYEMRYSGGRLVMNVDWVNQQSRQYLEDVAGLNDTLRLRGPQSALEKLTDETTQYKEVELTGVLRSTRTFDILDVDVQAG
jgi:hypothetical protein